MVNPINWSKIQIFYIDRLIIATHQISYIIIREMVSLQILSKYMFNYRLYIPQDILFIKNKPLIIIAPPFYTIKSFNSGFI